MIYDLKLTLFIELCSANSLAHPLNKMVLSKSPVFSNLGH